MPIPFDALCAYASPDVYNPWTDRDDLDLPSPEAGPAARLARLRAHFAVDARLVLVGEAAGYQGCHFSGMAFTNEKLMLEGRIPRISIEARITARPRPWCEPSATIVWGALQTLGIATTTVLWNAFAWHPHKPGNRYSNRAPTRSELEAGRAVLDGVLDAFAGAAVVAVGQVAGRTLESLGRRPQTVLRHPAMGGANAFRDGLTRFIESRRGA
jgi:uracil-DNA glycosylase